MVGCISYVNSYISEAGLHRRNTLPPIIFDLFSPPPAVAGPNWRGVAATSGREAGEGEESEGDSMAHRRGKPVKRKKPAKPEQRGLDFRPPSASSKVDIKKIGDFILFFIRKRKKQSLLR